MGKYMVTFEASGAIDVEAKSPEEAFEIAEKKALGLTDKEGNATIVEVNTKDVFEEDVCPECGAVLIRGMGDDPTGDDGMRCPNGCDLR